MLAPYAETLALIATITIITYFSVVLGELVPKRLALQNPEGIACSIAKPMRGLALIFSPIVWLLSISSRLLLKALRLDRTKMRLPSFGTYKPILWPCFTILGNDEKT